MLIHKPEQENQFLLYYRAATFVECNMVSVKIVICILTLHLLTPTLTNALLTEAHSQRRSRRQHNLPEISSFSQRIMAMLRETFLPCPLPILNHGLDNWYKLILSLFEKVATRKRNKKSMYSSIRSKKSRMNSHLKQVFSQFHYFRKLQKNIPFNSAPICEIPKERGKYSGRISWSHCYIF